MRAIGDRFQRIRPSLSTDLQRRVLESMQFVVQNMGPILPDDVDQNMDFRPAAAPSSAENQQPLPAASSGARLNPRDPTAGSSAAVHEQSHPPPSPAEHPVAGAAEGETNVRGRKRTRQPSKCHLMPVLSC